MPLDLGISQVLRAGGCPGAQQECHRQMAQFSGFSAYASTLCCPTCRARQEWTDQCRRCRSDLRLLRRVAEHCRQARDQALSALDEGRWFEALAHAQRAFALNPQPESRRLLAVCYLLANRPAEALALAASESDPPSAP